MRYLLILLITASLFSCKGKKSDPVPSTSTPGTDKVYLMKFTFNKPCTKLVILTDGDTLVNFDKSKWGTTGFPIVIKRWDVECYVEGDGVNMQIRDGYVPPNYPANGPLLIEHINLKTGKLDLSSLPE